MKDSKINPLTEKIFSILWSCKDMDSLILKGHILTGHALDFYIVKNTVGKINFKKQHFTFIRKIKRAEALGLFKKLTELLQVVKQFNQLRNSISHNLKHDEKILVDLLNKCHLFFRDEDYRAISNMKKDSQIIFDRGEEKTFISREHFTMMIFISNLCHKIFAEANISDME